jgi:hypothetical protein
MTTPTKIDPTKEATHKATPAQAERAFTISSMEDDTEYVKILFYGPFGSGKTTLAASAADVDAMSDILMLDIESGKMSLKKNKRIKRADRIDSVRISSFKQLGNVHNFLKVHCKFRDDPAREKDLISLEAKFRGVEAASIKKARRYNTVIIDSLSELDVLTMYELLGYDAPDEIDLNKIMNDGDMEVAEWPEFRKNNQMMQLIVRAYRDLPINVIFVCHQQYVQDEQKRMFYSPGMTGKLSSQVQSFVDIVGYLQVGASEGDAKEAPRRLSVQPVGKFSAKMRVADFNKSHFDDPTMKAIWEAVQS